MKKIIIVGLIIVLIILTGCETYRITCFDADDPEKARIWTENEISQDVAQTIAIRECHNGISNIVIKVEMID